MKNTVLLHVIFHGMVQGVFFRDTARTYANELKITGNICNLQDGTVELFAFGNRDAVEAFVSRLSGKNGPGRVDKMDREYREFDGEKEPYSDFRIVFG